MFRKYADVCLSYFSISKDNKSSVDSKPRLYEERPTLIIDVGLISNDMCVCSLYKLAVYLLFRKIYRVFISFYRSM